MPPALACQRCHVKKTKCDGTKPSCHACVDAGSPCVPHIRQQRSLDKRGVESQRRRVEWLENSLSKQLGVEVSTLRTGSDLGPLLNSLNRPVSLTDGHFAVSVGSGTAISESPQDQISPLHQGHRSDEVAIDVSPDISLLTLNASGEMRYLGPSSGSFFAQYALAFARTIASAQEASSGEHHGHGGLRSRVSRPTVTNFISTSKLESKLTVRTCQYLQRLYFKWVHVVWPLLDDGFQESVLDPLHDSQRRDKTASGSYMQRICLSTYYLVLALGAVHVDSWSSEDEQDSFAEYQRLNTDGGLAADDFFVKAIEVLDQISYSLSPSISLIRILVLICIYGSFKPSGNRQWQLAGIAIRTAVEIGLHRHRSNWNFSKDELDIRRRVFWVAYGVELTVSFNLGRPPCISDEHIDAHFPAETPEIALGLHHIRHRQAQARILSEIYCGHQKLAGVDQTQKIALISNNQESLDSWKSKLNQIYPLTNSPYPLQYWERLYYATTSAIHRPTPLIPIPSFGSANRCIRAAGDYIDAHHYLFKSKKVPQSWMLLQGMVLAGITMIVTARTNKAFFPDRMKCSVIEIMEWNRKCSVVLNIMSERWSDQTISDLESKFSLLANDTLKQLMLPAFPPPFTAPAAIVSQENYADLPDALSESRFRAAADQHVPPDTAFGASMPQQTSPWSTAYNLDSQNGDPLIFSGNAFTGVNDASSTDFPFGDGSMDFFPLETFLGMDDMSLWGIPQTQDDMNIDWLGSF